MPKRISNHSLNKKGKDGRTKWIPDLKEWTEVCKIYPYDKNIIDYFDIAKETFYSFLDKQRYEKENKRPSEFLDSYKSGRNNTKKFVIGKLLKAIERDDIAAIIFGAKSIGGVLESKDIAMIEIKQKEYELKEQAFKLSTEKFINELCEKHSLDKKETLETLNKHLDAYATRK